MGKSSGSARVTDTLARKGLAQRLFDLRLDTRHNNRGKITQEELAGRLNGVLPKSGKPVSKKMISSWETGATEPGLREIAGLARVFNTTCDSLLTGVNAPRVDAARRYGLSNEALQLLEEWNTHPGIYDGIEGAHEFPEISPVVFVNQLLVCPSVRKVAETVVRQTLEHTWSFVDSVEQRFNPQPTPPKKQPTSQQLREKKAVEAIFQTNPEFMDKKIVSASDYFTSQTHALAQMWNRLLSDLEANIMFHYYDIVPDDQENRRRMMMVFERFREKQTTPNARRYRLLRVKRRQA